MPLGQRLSARRATISRIIGARVKCIHQNRSGLWPWRIFRAARDAHKRAAVRLGDSGTTIRPTGRCRRRRQGFTLLWATIFHKTCHAVNPAMPKTPSDVHRHLIRITLAQVVAGSTAVRLAPARIQRIGSPGLENRGWLEAMTFSTEPPHVPPTAPCEHRIRSFHAARM